MTIAISGPAGAAGTAAAPAVKAHPAADAPAASSAAAEDKVTISAAAQELPQAVSMLVLALHNQGQSVPQIATQLAISPSAVQGYSGTPAAAPKG